MTEPSRAQQAIDRITDVVSNLSGNYGAGSVIIEQLGILAVELNARDAQILRAVTQASNVATRTDPGRLFALEQKAEAFEQLQAAWREPGTESDFLEFCVDFDWDIE